MSDEDFSPNRKVALLNHQKSLVSQNVPLSAQFLIKKTGVVDDFVKENDIYDNHFLYVVLPFLTGSILMQDDGGEFRMMHLHVFGAMLWFSVSSGDQREVLCSFHMSDVDSISSSSDLCDEHPLLEEYLFTIHVGERRINCVSKSLQSCISWRDVDMWCDFYTPNVLVDPDAKEMDNEIVKIECDVVFDVYEWLGLERKVHDKNNDLIDESMRESQRGEKEKIIVLNSDDSETEEEDTGEDVNSQSESEEEDMKLFVRHSRDSISIVKGFDVSVSAKVDLQRIKQTFFCCEIHHFFFSKTNLKNMTKFF